MKMPKEIYVSLSESDKDGYRFFYKTCKMCRADSCEGCFLNGKRMLIYDLNGKEIILRNTLLLKNEEITKVGELDILQGL